MLDADYEEIIFIDKSKRYYKKCIVQGDKLVGAILVGDKNEFAEFRELIANGTELSEKRLQLLRASKKVDPLEGKLVCSCNTVGQGNLERAIQAGCTDFQQLCQKTGAGTGCGSCRPEVRSILETMSERLKERKSAITGLRSPEKLPAHSLISIVSTSLNFMRDYYNVKINLPAGHCFARYACKRYWTWRTKRRSGRYALAPVSNC